MALLFDIFVDALGTSVVAKFVDDLVRNNDDIDDDIDDNNNDCILVFSYPLTGCSPEKNISYWLIMNIFFLRKGHQMFFQIFQSGLAFT